MDTDEQLFHLLRTLGVRVEYTDLPFDRDGEYLHRRRLIRLRSGMARRLYRSVLAHECAHAVFGDVAATSPHLAERVERRADEWAARFLISRDAYAWAEELCDGHVEALALELDVTVDTVQTFQRVLARTASRATDVSERAVAATAR